MTALETAIAYASKGWYVFPIQPGSKHPYGGFKWGEQCTNDPTKVKAAGEHPRYANCNWAVNCGKSNLLVVDVDMDAKNGKDGEKSILSLPALEPALEVKTPRGGRHLYFAGVGPTSQGTLGVGIDTRGHGGYVLIPGSVRPEGAYTITKQGEPTPAPRWLTDRLGAVVEKRADRADAVCELDTTPNIERATEYLINHAPEAVEGSGGDTATYEVACRVRDFGVSEDAARELMSDYWNQLKARPPWSEEELARKVRNAYQYSRDRAGNSAPEVVFPPPSRSTEAVQCAADIKIEKLRPRDWVLSTRYIKKYVTVTVAPGAAGKSSLVILEGLSIASGKDLTYQHVRAQGPVWYFNTEDPLEEIQYRVMAAAKQHNLERKHLKDFYFSSGRVNPLVLVKDHRGELVVNTEGVEWLITGIKSRGAVLLVMDPFVSCHGVNENDNMAINLVVQQFQKIADLADCAISIVHHTSKGSSDNGNMDKARGASALVNAARVAHTFYTMSVKEAAEYNVQEGRHKWFARLDSAKENLSPPSSITEWYERKSVNIFWDSNETIGTLEPARLLQKVVKEDSGESIVQYAINTMEINAERSFADLATVIEKTSLFGLKAKQIQRYLEAKLGGAMSIYDDRCLIPCQMKGKSGRWVPGIRRIPSPMVNNIANCVHQEQINPLG